jgi:hypothetical protein
LVSAAPAAPLREGRAAGLLGFPPSACRELGITCSICGQAPSVYPELSEKLVEWGIGSISVNPDVLGKTRRIIAAAERRRLLGGVRRRQAAAGSEQAGRPIAPDAGTPRRKLIEG